MLDLAWGYGRHNIAEITEIFRKCGVTVLRGYGDYDTGIPMDPQHIQIPVVSEKR